MDFDESFGTQSIKAISNSSRISYGYCKTICSGVASQPSQFVDMSVSLSQPFDWIKEQSKDPELKEVVNFIRKHKLYPRKIKKGDSSVIKALLRMKGQLKLIKGAYCIEKPFWDNSAERKPRFQLIFTQAFVNKGIGRVVMIK